MMQKRLSLAFLAVMIALFIGSAARTTPVQAQTATWTATFYPNTTFTAPGTTATYSSLNFNFGTGAPTDGSGNPVAGIPADNFSATFSSAQTLAAGTYTFTLSVDDRATVTLNGVPIFDVKTPGTVQSVNVQIQGGTTNMVVSYIEFTSVAYMQLQWALIGGGGGGVVPGTTPGTAVSTPTETMTPTITVTGLPSIPAGAITATVIRADVLNARQTPSTGAARVARLLRGQTYQVIGRDADARWFLLQLSGFQGWAYGYYLAFNTNEFNAPVLSGNALINLAGQTDYGVRGQTFAGLRLRAAPTTSSAQTGRIDWGAFLPIIGRTANGSWFKVVWRDTVGWVYAPFVEIVEGNLSAVPIEG